VASDSRIDLIVAGLDLQLVRFLRQAIRSADLSSGKALPVHPLGPAPTFSGGGTRARVEPEPRFDPRPVIEPTPRFEPRRWLRPHDAACPKPPAPPEPAVVEPEVPRADRSPIEPPWKVLPAPEPSAPAQPSPKVKPAVQRPDLYLRGTMLDIFI
jgi:hypothetical protein